MSEENLSSSVIDFFNGGHVLITGSTGFMGKVLLEKLLRTCQGIEQLYLLIRVKRGKEPTSRLKELFDDPIFEPLKTQYPEYLKKVTVVPGDCSCPNLGLTISDYEFLKSTVTHVFHGAATVRFDEKLHTALKINVQGVKEMLRLCAEIENLKVVLHTSTAYANCPIKEINEEFYPPPMNGEKALALLDCLEEEKINLISKELIKPWPNTYSFTKAIGEDVVKKFGSNLPIAIFRPSIVVSTATEPVPGWIDNLYGPTGVVAGVGAGLLRVLLCDINRKADIVPVDYSVNALICAAWEVGLRHSQNKRPSEELPRIFNYAADEDNSIIWGDYLKLSFKHGLKGPTIRTIWYNTITLTAYRPLYTFFTILYHLLPALIMDAGLLISGNKAKLWAAYRKVHKFANVISFFGLTEWKFHRGNTLRLWQSLTPTDQINFNFNMNTLNWDTYIKSHVAGIRLYLFNDPISTLPSARRKLFMFYIAHRALQLIVFCAVLWISYSVINAFLDARPDFFSLFSTNRWASRKSLIS